MLSITIYPTGVFRVFDGNDVLVGGDWKTLQDAVNNYDVVNVMGVTDPLLGVSVSQAWNLGELDSRFFDIDSNKPTSSTLRNERAIRVRSSVQILGDEATSPVLQGALFDIGGQTDNGDLFIPHNWSLMPAIPPTVVISKLNLENIPGVSIFVTSCELLDVSYCNFSKPVALKFIPQLPLTVSIMIVNYFLLFTSALPITTSSDPIEGTNRIAVRNNISVTHCNFDGEMYPGADLPNFRHQAFHFGPTDTNLEIAHNIASGFVDSCIHLVDMVKSVGTLDLGHESHIHHNIFTMNKVRCPDPPFSNITNQAAVIRSFQTGIITLPGHSLLAKIHDNNITLNISEYLGLDSSFFIGGICCDSEHFEVFQNNILVDGVFVEGGQDLRPTYAIFVSTDTDKPVTAPLVSHNTISGNCHYGLLLLAEQCFPTGDRFARFPIGDPATLFTGNDWNHSSTVNTVNGAVIFKVVDPLIIMNNLENLNAIYDYLLDASVSNAIVRSSDKEGPAQRVLDLTLSEYAASIKFKSDYEHVMATPIDYEYPNWSRNLV
ncbi:MAG: hypothetical protein Q8P20_11175 [bacterium]|nr:hypothetical protein [bacterium]